MPLNGIDHVEMYVGNAAQAAYFYEHAFGFRPVAYAGLETGRPRPHLARARAGPDPPRPDRRAALGLRDRPPPRPPRRRRPLDRALGPRRRPTPTPRRSAAARAASPSPHDVDRRARRRSARRRSPTYGDTLHTFVDRSGYDGPFLPGFEAVAGSRRRPATTCCSRSTTSSATSSSATWRSGSTSTRTSSGWSR